MTWHKDRIVELLLEAGGIGQRLKSDMRCELKSDRSIVTAADREIEALFSRELERPESGTYLIGEETIAQKGEAYIEKAFEGETYLVDPIDGTAPYAHHLPLWGVSIGRMEGGVLSDGGVYLPDMGEMVVSEGEESLLGRREGSRWEWRPLGPLPPRAPSTTSLISITQGIAKRGKVMLPNPVLVLGVAVVPLLGLLQGRFLAYLGSVKLWDIAGVLPHLLRKGFSVTVHPDGERRAVTCRVDESAYHLAPSSKARWALRSHLLICRPEDELHLRGSFSGGDIDRKDD